MNRTKRILITSAGGLVGTFLIKHFREMDNYYLVGTDMSGYVPLKEKLNAYYLVMPNISKGYLEAIKSIIEKERIEIIIPVSSYDIEIYSKKSVRELLKPAKMLLIDYDFHKILHNKEKCSQFLSQFGIAVPKFYFDKREIIFPCILKPDESSGSKDVKYLEKEEDFLYWKKRIKNYTLSEYLDGTEYTVDCLFDNSGQCLGYNARERVKINSGGAVVSKCVKEERLVEVIGKLEKLKVIKGPVNFQYKIVNNKICIFDFNTRFASGGLPLSVCAGFDIPKMLVNIISGKQVKHWNLDEKDIGLTMIRYYEENYVRK